MDTFESTSTGTNTCSDDCPFCKTKKLKGFNTKHGELKDEKQLGKNLRSDSDKEITSDPKVGNIYPLPGGGDSTQGWEAKAGALESFPVKLAAAPHHLIPGNASMAPSRIENWTLESKSKIKQDIGYSIDCAKNGIFLPHLPEIYFTRFKPGTKTQMAKYYGQTWRKLSYSSKKSIGFLVMAETQLQMHYTNHSDPYVHMDDESTYDDECKLRCNQLADLMQQRSHLAKCKDDDGKLYPPYELVHMINSESEFIQMNITGRPTYWSSWVSPLAQDYTHYLKTEPGARHTIKFLIRRLT